MKDELDSKIVVTGGSGFIGSHMVQCLKKHSYTNITIVDLMSPKFNGVKFVKADFDNTKIVNSVLNDAKYIFHFAAMVGVDNCRLHPKKVYEVNDKNTKKFIDLCLNKGVKRFIFSSSSEIYGNSRDIPYRENGRPEPFSDYAKCKISIEKYLQQVSNRSKMTAGVIRLFNIYGVGQKKDFVISIFIDKALKNLPLTILGDGEQTRCFTYVEDAVEGIFKTFRYSDTPFEIFNIGNPDEYTINQLAVLVLETISDSGSGIIHEHYGAEIRNINLEIKHRVPDVNKTNRVLNFSTTISLKDGLIKVIEDSRLNLQHI